MSPENLSSIVKFLKSQDWAVCGDDSSVILIDGYRASPADIALACLSRCCKLNYQITIKRRTVFTGILSWSVELIRQTDGGWDKGLAMGSDDLPLAVFNAVLQLPETK